MPVPCINSDLAVKIVAKGDHSQYSLTSKCNKVDSISKIQKKGKPSVLSLSLWFTVTREFHMRLLHTNIWSDQDGIIRSLLSKTER